jgi:hypothetical protein
MEGYAMKKKWAYLALALTIITGLAAILQGCGSNTSAPAPTKFTIVGSGS